MSKQLKLEFSGVNEKITGNSVFRDKEAEVMKSLIDLYLQYIEDEKEESDGRDN